MLPIEKYENIQQAIDNLKEWQLRLGLNNWAIKIEFCEPHEFVGDNRDGECEYGLGCKSAVIRILKQQYYGDRLIKYCAERILVHELLHCAWGHLGTNSDGRNRLLHSIQEDMARALICAKYNIDFDWFFNIHYDKEDTA